MGQDVNTSSQLVSVSSFTTPHFQHCLIWDNTSECEWTKNDVSMIGEVLPHGHAMSLLRKWKIIKIFQKAAFIAVTIFNESSSGVNQFLSCSIQMTNYFSNVKLNAICSNSFGLFTGRTFYFCRFSYNMSNYTEGLFLLRAVSNWNLLIQLRIKLFVMESNSKHFWALKKGKELMLFSFF